MKIGGMGGLELVIILVVVLLIFGPKNLPKLGSAIGKTVSNLRSGMNDGKKKEPEAAEGDASATTEAAASDAQPAAIEGEVEFVETVEDAAGSEDAETPEEAAEPENAEGPKKVKRVVKKKATTE